MRWPGVMIFAVSIACGTASQPRPDVLHEDSKLSGPIHSLSLDALNSDSADLDFLAKMVGDARIIQLGESAHGVAQFNGLKSTVIRYLHEHMGFDVLAFETSLLDCWRLGTARPRTALNHLETCAFGVWWTEEVLDLFEYIEGTHETSRPLRVVGFDIQFSSRMHRARAAWVRDFLAPYDEEMAAELYALDSAFVSTFRPTNPDEYEVFADRLFAQRHDIAQATGQPVETVVLLVATLRSVAAFQRTLSSATPEDRVVQRDRGMARNLITLADHVFPEAKIVTWGHNFHIRRANSGVEPYRYRTMGQWIDEHFGDDVMNVGMYMGRGTAANNDRSTYHIALPPDSTLEHQLESISGEVLFIDLRGHDGAGTEWAGEWWPMRSWGRTETVLVPRDQYDALVYVKRVTPPMYVEMSDE